ncbi:methyltransferase type 11 [Crinalium epipsammum PCC 9333]|uniref:Methyltransferase type 11 n=1 Tax=Crinalium epipsammum PCC 9333 TaxID=1173022 RepID=K9W5W4_9CYAN|nr:hypothetical protein [Crinalium epipsammum]AFZ15189.1 methyltransferase type 11 [Crinalium epipsammum PCC 9333]
MKYQIDGDIYKQQVANYFNQRNNYDAEGEFHPKLAQRFLEYTNILSKQKVLDVATGTKPTT